MRAVLFVIFALALTTAFIDSETKKEFKDWLKEHGKNYTNPAEFIKREAIYAKNKAKRVANNIKFKAGQIGWEEAANEFSDLTTEEFLKRLGYKNSTIDTNTNDTNTLTAEEAFPGSAKRFGLIDWRQKGKVNAVKNQGGCGSCWTFSSTAVVEACVGISLNISPPDLSEQNFMDCLFSKTCDQGGWPSGAIDYAKSNGQALRADYPYVTKTGQCHQGPRKAHVGQRVSGKTEADLERMLNSGVVSVALDATLLQGYKRGVLDATNPHSTNHAVTVVALTTNCDGRSDQCWVVRNSWGAGWGESGYFRVAKGKPAPGAIGIAQVLDTATGCTLDGQKPVTTGGNSNNGGDNGNCPNSIGSQLVSNGKNTLTAGGQVLTSPNCQFKLTLQKDGNLVVYDASNKAKWSLNKYNSGDSTLVLQADGNLVEFSFDKLVLWSSNTYKKGSAPYKLSINNNGDLAITDKDGKSVWNSS